MTSEPAEPSKPSKAREVTASTQSEQTQNSEDPARPGDPVKSDAQPKSSRIAVCLKEARSSPTVKPSNEKLDGSAHAEKENPPSKSQSTTLPTTPNNQPIVKTRARRKSSSRTRTTQQELIEFNPKNAKHQQATSLSTASPHTPPISRTPSVARTPRTPTTPTPAIPTPAAPTPPAPTKTIMEQVKEAVKDAAIKMMTPAPPNSRHKLVPESDPDDTPTIFESVNAPSRPAVGRMKKRKIGTTKEEKHSTAVMVKDETPSAYHNPQNAQPHSDPLSCYSSTSKLSTARLHVATRSRSSQSKRKSPK